MTSGKPRIAIPVPTSGDPEYNRSSMPPYLAALQQAGAEPVEVELTLSQRQVARLLASCHAVLLPGAGPDMNPQKYGAERLPACNPDDPARENVDELLLQDAHNLHKPIFGICYGMQGLNVWRTGTLVQDLAPMPVNHRAGRSVAVAHTVDIDPTSLLAEIVRSSSGAAEQIVTADGFIRLDVNSSHHQAVAIPGDGLRIAARCPLDGVIQCVESIGATTAGHFVLGVQWHPERTCTASPASRALFARFVQAACAWTPRSVTESVAVG